jgi:hypothetical protein
MGLTALKGKKLTRKKTIRAKSRVGIAGVSLDKGFRTFKDEFHVNVDRKEIASNMKSYIKSKMTKDDQRDILANPEYKFYTFSHYAATAFWSLNKLESEDLFVYYEAKLYDYLLNLIELGRDIRKEKTVEETVNVISLSPMQRLQNKISDTIMQDMLDLEDQWMNGEKTTIDLYKLFQTHGLSGSATLPVRQVIAGWLLDYEDAYYKRDADAVEGYAHLKKSDLNHRIKSCQDMLLDLDKIQSAAKANRKVRKPKIKSADKQVARVQYKKEDNNFKLVSINPILLIGSKRLYTFNTKYKVLVEYCTQSANGFEISGSTIKNLDKVNSREIKLRKPDEFLPIVLKKTIKQIDTEWSKLTTKTIKTNGRINKDTILLRVMDK